MSYHCLNAVVYVRSRGLRIGNGSERSDKHSRQLDASHNIREIQPIVSSRITVVTFSRDFVVTYSDVSDQHSNTVLCLSHTFRIFTAVFGRTIPD